MNDISALFFSVSGRVQGVGFRAFTSSVARDLGLAGEVWNTRHGGVEGFVQGTPDDVRQFVANLHTGPGRVDGVHTNEKEAKPGLTSFSVTSTR